MSLRSKARWGTALALFAGACSDGGSGAPTPASVTATTPTAMTATVGTLVTHAPGVRVVDSKGRGVSGVPVSFAVTAGGGTLGSTTASTDREGAATAGPWTLGRTAGANTVTAAVAGMAPVTFTATGTAGAPALAAKVSGDPGSAAVGTTLPPFVLRVTDRDGNPVSGVAVTFAVTSGAGTLAPANAATDADGRAATTATLGGRVEAFTVTATAPALPPVTFSVEVRAGPAARISKVAGDDQQGRTGTAVAVAPSVRVTDAAGNPVSGAAVTFAVASGGGSVTLPAATTGASGTATVGSWVLGAVGTNTLTAMVPGAGSVTFTATATAAGPADPCATAAAFTLRTTVAGTLSTADCRLPSGEYIDFYRTTLTAGQPEEITLTSGAFDTFLYLMSASGQLLAADDDGLDGGTTGNSSVRVYAPAGEYLVAASSYDPGSTGAYQLSSRAMTARTGCGAQGWIVPGVTFSGTLAAGDCAASDGSRIDFYPVVLRAGQRLTVTMRSTAFDTYLYLLDDEGRPISANDDGAGGTDSRISYTAPAEGVYYIGANSFTVSGTGTYTLTVTSP